MAAKNTPHGEPPSPGTRYLERKRRLAGDIAEFGCTLALYEPPLVIVRYVFVPGGESFNTPVPIPAGTISLGYFWIDRPYNAYRMRSPNGEIVGHRFDAVADVQIGFADVSYRDLELDWWLIPGHALIEEDRDDFEAALAAGALTPADGVLARQATQVLTLGIDRVIAELAALETEIR